MVILESRLGLTVCAFLDNAPLVSSREGDLAGPLDTKEDCFGAAAAEPA